MDEEKLPTIPWCRYADDGLAHCETEEEAHQLLAELTTRFKQCGLELHPHKTKIVYCKDGGRKKDYPNKSFDFLGYTFRARLCKNSRRNSMFMNFTPAVSKEALKSMRAMTRKYDLSNRTDLSLADIARWYNPILRGWLNYYGKYSRSALYPVWRHFNKTLVAWARRKYKLLQRHKTKAGLFIERISVEQPNLFVHWRAGMRGAIA
jgi:RNA-directed DNA polymerase